MIFFICQRFLLKSGDAVHIYSNSQSITLQLRHEVPTEMDLAATYFKAAVPLTPGDALSIAGELLTAAAAQLKSKGLRPPKTPVRRFGRRESAADGH
jgi:hypothetical protein